MASFYDAQGENRWRTYFLFAVFLFMLFVVSYAFGAYLGFGSYGVSFAVIISVLLTVVMYYKSDSIVLASTGARPADKKEHAYLINAVEGLSLAAGIPVPKIYVMEDESINAFATGRDPQHAIVVATTGAIKKLDRLELEGVLAHELSHVKNYDIRVMMLATVFAGVVILVADMFTRSMFWGGGRRDNDRGGGAIVIIGLIFALLAPIFAQLIKLAISRQREYLADASGAQLTRYPDGLAGALEKIGKDTARMRNPSEATAHLFISNPLRASSFANWFSTHPPLEERIRRLRAM